MTGAVAATAGHGGPRFSVGSGDVTDDTLDPSVGAASLKFESDGDRIAANNSGTVDEGDWITPKSLASLFNSSCTIRAHVDSSTGSGLGGGSAAVDTDLALTSDRTWVVSQTGVGTSSATITFTLKRNGTTVSTAQRTIAATVN